MTAIAVVVVGAAILGLVANAFLHPVLDRFHKQFGVDKMKTDSWASGALGPSVTLLALFLAFVLADAASSFSEARSATRSEATVIERIYTTSGFLEEPYRQRLQRSTVCYARAVAGPEWKEMADGGMSDLPPVWTGTGPRGLRTTFSEMGGDHVLFRTLINADQARAAARRTRITQASPSIPQSLITFLIVVIAAVLLYHAVTSPPRSFLHALATVVSTATMLAALALTHTLDRPFSGAIEIGPTQMQTTAHDLTADFVSHFGVARVGCDRDGRPTKVSAS